MRLLTKALLTQGFLHPGTPSPEGSRTATKTQFGATLAQDWHTPGRASLHRAHEHRARPIAPLATRSRRAAERLGGTVRRMIARADARSGERRHADTKERTS